MSQVNSYDRESYTTNGVTKTFSFGWDVNDKSDVKVKFVDDNGVVVEYATFIDQNDQEYTTSNFSFVVELNRQGGTITFVDTPAENQNIIIYRQTELVYENSFKTATAFPASAIDAAYRKIWLAIQEVQSDATHNTVRMTSDQRGLTFDEFSDTVNNHLVYYADSTLSYTEFTTVDVANAISLASQVPQALSVASEALTKAGNAITIANSAKTVAEQARDDASTAIQIANTKQDILVSGTNIKTINGLSILGGGDLIITASAEWSRIIGDIYDNNSAKTALDAKQDVISDLETIRAGAEAGATAVQPSDLATVATSGSYNDLSDKPTLGTAAAADTTDFATAAQGALADTALQPSALNNVMPINSVLVPNLDGKTPIATYTFTTNNTTYKPIFRIPNTETVISDIPDTNVVMRITATGTGINATMDCIVSLQKSTSSSLLTAIRNHPNSAALATVGFDYVRTIIPRAFDNGYDWVFELRGSNTTLRTVKVEVFYADSNVVFVADGSATTFNNTYQAATTITLTTIEGLILSPTMPWTVQTANVSGYINTYLNKFIGGTQPTAGAAILTQTIVFKSGNLLYGMDTTDKPIDTGWGVAHSQAPYSLGGVPGWTNIQSKRRILSLANIPHNTLNAGDSCYMRCTMDASGNIYSDNYVDTQMSAGYTWIYVGQAESATVLLFSVEGSQFLTLDADGKLSHVNGKEISGNGGGSVAIDNTTITENASQEIQAVAVIDQNSGIAKTWTGTQAEYDAIVTKDPDTEYIITDDIGGPATVIAELAEAVNDKADKDDAVGYCSFNTTTRVQITTTDQTAAKNGWLMGYVAFSGSNVHCDVLVNNIVVGRLGWTTTGNWFGASVQVPIKAGQAFRVSTNGTIQDNQMYFYPND